MIKDFKNKFWSYEILTCNNGSDSKLEHLADSFSSSNIDLNPHQIEAALFALKNPAEKGVILADEVGLGKTIEAGLVLSEYFLKDKKHLIVICPKTLTKQWEIELKEKFDIPTRLLDKKVYDSFRGNHINSLDFDGVLILSYNFASSMYKELQIQPFDLCVIDEAHKLRNYYKGSLKIADNLYNAFLETHKILLTATPIQNSLMDLYSLVSFIDETIFGNEFSFMNNFMSLEKRHDKLKDRLKNVLHRTLRKNVLEYIRYTNREAITINFNPSKEEEELYHLISDYISKKSTFGVLTGYRSLIVLMIRKLMSSSTAAVRGTLEGIRKRLKELKENQEHPLEIAEFIGDKEFAENYSEDLESEEKLKPPKNKPVNLAAVNDELNYLENLINLSNKIKIDGKTEKLLTALETGFDKILSKGGLKKAIIFTESQRTLEYLYKYLSKNGYENKIVTFSGSNSKSVVNNKIYEEYKKNNLGGDVSASKDTLMRQAILDKFKNDSEIMIATEAAAEGLNLQFCSLLVNYDLPWNPQRVEQRIGRIHRYGQKHDVVIINFINKKNIADVKLYDILRHKFKLFDGIFGASDEILGALTEGLDFEKEVSAIFDNCRTTAEIETAFDILQNNIAVEETLENTRTKVLDNMAPSLAERLRVLKHSVENLLERHKDIFWRLTKNIKNNYYFNEDSKVFGTIKEQVFKLTSDVWYARNFSFKLDFSLKEFPSWLVDKKEMKLKPFIYNPTTKEGQEVIKQALNLNTPKSHLVSHIEGQKGKGLLKITIYTQTTPEKKYKMIATFLNEKGEDLNITPANFFDNLESVSDILNLGSETKLNTTHSLKVDKVIEQEQLFIDNLLKSEIEKLNRWAYEEKDSLSLQIRAFEDKLAGVNRRYKAEKDIDKKYKIGYEVQKIMDKISDIKLNGFDIQESVNKKATDLIGAKKRILKHKYEIEDIIIGSFELV